MLHAFILCFDLVLQRHFRLRVLEGLEDAGPEASLAPQAVAAIDGVPWAELRWEFVPGGIGAQHPEDAGQDGAGGSADAADGCSGSKERLHTDPPTVGEV